MCVAFALYRDTEKLRLKPRNFKFAPVKGWLGGDMTEKVEGWKCTVYEATGKVRNSPCDRGAAAAAGLVGFWRSHVHVLL